MEHTLWILVFGATAAFLNAVTVGANLIANCWGPVLGARVVKYRTAVILGVLCQVAGALAFGPRTCTIYGGFLDDLTSVKAHPGLTMYAIMWTVITPVVWQFLAIWQQILVPAYLATVASTVGAALVFPGASFLEFGNPLDSPPFLSGLGPIFLTWLCAPCISILMVTFGFLVLKGCVLRGEDAFHKVLWLMPAAACFTAVVLGFFLIEVVGSPLGTEPLNMPAQEVVIVLAALGSLACILWSLAVPHARRQMMSRGPTIKALKRMNLLGLDDITVQDLAVQDRSGDMKGWLQRVHTWLFDRDLFAGVVADDNLMRIHATAEEYEPAAEEQCGPFQVIACLCLSVAHGANNSRTSVGVFTIMRALHKSGVVTSTVNVGFKPRIMGAVGMTLGTLLLGFRLAPVSAVQLAKMTPCRSAIVMLYTALSISILAILQLKGGVITYVIVCGVTALGFSEGSSHVNWRKVLIIMVWWFVGFFCVLGATYLLTAQGMYAPAHI